MYETKTKYSFVKYVFLNTVSRIHFSAVFHIIIYFRLALVVYVFAIPIFQAVIIGVSRSCEIRRIIYGQGGMLHNQHHGGSDLK